jgi:hypothetical protein
MKYLIAFLILLSTATFAIAQDKPLCEEYKCYAAFNWGFNDMFGFGSSSTGSTPSGDYLLLPSSTDKLLLPNGTDALMLP